MSETLVVKVNSVLSSKDYRDLCNYIVKSKALGTVVLPFYCDPFIVPDGCNVKVEAPDKSYYNLDPEKKKMKVYRSQAIETSEFIIGDQIEIELKGFGKFFATVHKVFSDEVLFIFNDCICEQPMNESGTNKGGYAGSKLAQYLKDVVLPAFPDDIRPKIRELTIPTCGQIFGHDDFYKKHLTPDHDEQLPLMKRRQYRLAMLNDDLNWYWLQNPVKDEVLTSFFAYVTNHGNTNGRDASDSLGVRPAFLLATD